MVRSFSLVSVPVQGAHAGRLGRPKVRQLAVRLPSLAVIPMHHGKLEPSALRLALPESQEFAVQASLSIGTGVPPESRRLHLEPFESGISAPIWEGSDSEGKTPFQKGDGRLNAGFHPNPTAVLNKSIQLAANVRRFESPQSSLEDPGGTVQAHSAARPRVLCR